MRGSRTYLIAAVLGVILVAVVAYSVFHRVRARTTTQTSMEAAASISVPTPANAASVRAVTAVPNPRSSKDKELTAKFRQSRVCYAASGELSAAKNVADCSFFEGKPQFEQQYAKCLNFRVDAQNRVASAERILASCGDTGGLARKYFEATNAAAKNGDVDAQLCYLQANFFDARNLLLLTQADIAEYKKTASQYKAAAFQRADWRIVELLGTKRLHANGELLHFLEDKIGERETVYKMMKLLRLGATDEYARLLDMSLRDMHHPDLEPTAMLPQEKTAEGDAWAQQAYAQFFAGTASLTKAPVVCETITHLG